jgi:hypothetical protein
VLVLIVAGVVALGFYRGWFHLTSDKAADQSNVTLTVDKDKIQQDKQKAQDKVQGHRAEDKAAPAAVPGAREQTKRSPP